MLDHHNRHLKALTSAALLGVAFGCVAFLRYSWSRFEPGASALQVTMFMGLPGSLAVGALFMLRHSVGTRLRVFISFTSVGVTLLAVELLLSLAPSNQQTLGAGVRGGDSRTALEVVRDLRASGVNAFPSPGAWQLHTFDIRVDGEPVVPLAPGVPAGTMVLCNEQGEWLTYEGDEQGFNNPPGSWRHRVDIALLGDSFVEGQCVSSQESLGGLIRDQWPSTLNLGVRGSGPLHQLAVLKEYGVVIQPKVTVWFYYEGNDLNDLRNEMSFPALTRYLSDSEEGRLWEWTGEVNDLVRVKLDSIVRDVSTGEAPRAWTPWEVIKLTRLRSLMGPGFHFPEADPLGAFPDILRAARQTVETWDGKLVLVSLPEYRRFTLFSTGAPRRSAALMIIAERLGGSSVTENVSS